MRFLIMFVEIFNRLKIFKCGAICKPSYYYAYSASLEQAMTPCEEDSFVRQLWRQLVS
jgi:hypothetical protein